MIDDRKIREALRQASYTAGGPCPDEETFAAFMEGKLPEAEKEKVAAHIMTCADCRDAMAVAWGEVPRRLRVPIEATRRAIELLPEKRKIWEVAVRFASDFVEVVRNTGLETQYFSPAYATSRSGRAAKASLVACTENLGGIDTELEIEHVSPGAGEIKVNMKEGGGVPNPSIRVTLRRDGKELASYMAAQGSTVFESVSVGKYEILLSRKGISLGEIALEMKGELP